MRPRVGRGYRRRAMFVHPDIHHGLAREKQRDAIAAAERSRLARHARHDAADSQPSSGPRMHGCGVAPTARLGLDAAAVPSL